MGGDILDEGTIFWTKDKQPLGKIEEVCLFVLLFYFLLIVCLIDCLFVCFIGLLFDCLIV